MKNGTLLAAVDMGSNSYRLEIGRYDHGDIQRTEYYKEMVRQGNGLDENKDLTPEAMQRGWDCLSRFAERIRGFAPQQVRAVATQTLREARNREEFLSKAREVLGFPIDVIPGREEARLIYQGVTHLLPQSDERRLVIDIGGRSTELILGSGYTSHEMASYRLGSVSWSMRYFPDGAFNADAFRSAEIAATAILDEALSLFPRRAWDVAYGSSGTVGALADVLQAYGFAPGLITREGLDWTQDQLLKVKWADRLRMEGLKGDRKSVIGGGLSILRAAFDLLGIDELHAADGALRQGVLYDLLDRDLDGADLRSITVRRLATKFAVDVPQAERVERVAVGLMSQLVAGEPQPERVLKKLGWAAQLHEVGDLISPENGHLHGAYILAHADAPGFSMPEMERLALMVQCSRGKPRKFDVDFDDTTLIRQLLSLRLAMLLCHARHDPDVGSLRLQREAQAVVLACSKTWAEQYPQSLHLLREEAEAWSKSPWSLRIAAK